MLTPDVEAAIGELRNNYPNATVISIEDGLGGAYILIDELGLGPPFREQHTWVGFHVTHGCPYADVYPHFVRGDLARADGQPLGEGMGTGHVFPPEGVILPPGAMRRAAVQISRRSNNRHSLETPLIKLLKVLQWLNSR